jgi:hypothetical protein
MDTGLPFKSPTSTGVAAQRTDLKMKGTRGSNDGALLIVAAPEVSKRGCNPAGTRRK